MKRNAPAILAVLLLLLSALVALLWVRSYLVSDLAQYYKSTSASTMADDQESYQFSSANGGLSLAWGTTRYVYSTTQEAARVRQQSRCIYDGRFRLVWHFDGGRWYGGSLYSPAHAHHLLGFAFRSFSAGGASRGWELTLPWPVPLLIASSYPGLRMWRVWRERHGPKAGYCRTCGYDLRASQDRCPECGSPIAVPEAPTC